MTVIEQLLAFTIRSLLTASIGHLLQLAITLQTSVPLRNFSTPPNVRRMLAKLVAAWYKYTYPRVVKNHVCCAVGVLQIG